MGYATPFKTCSNCSAYWPTRQDFLNDPAIRVIGFQPCLEEPELGLFLFQHDGAQCGTCLALKVTLFSDLTKDTRPHENAFQTRECPGHCLRVDDFTPCSISCHNAYFRKIMQAVVQYPKAASSTI